jgi:hypothetical protein
MKACRTGSFRARHVLLASCLETRNRSDARASVHGTAVTLMPGPASGYRLAHILDRTRICRTLV